MWYDATSAAGSVESSDSKVAGKVGYVRAPVKETDRLRLAVVVEPRASTPSPTTRTQAWQFLKWATSKEYAKLVGSQLGWSKTPPGTRKSTYQIPEYIEAGGEFAPLTAQIMSEVDPKQPGVKPQPWVGIQYVTIPEFQDVGNQTSQLVADAIAGRRPLQLALGPRPEDRRASRREPEGGLKWPTRSRPRRRSTSPWAGRPAGRPPRSRSRARTWPSAQVRPEADRCPPWSWPS